MWYAIQRDQRQLVSLARYFQKTVCSSHSLLTFFTQQEELLKDQLKIDCSVISFDFVHEILVRIPFKTIIKTKDTKVTKFKIITC